MWNLIDVKNWDEAKNVIANVLKNGTEESYKTVAKKVLQVGDELVEVTYKKMADGTIRVSDAWVKTK